MRSRGREVGFGALAAVREEDRGGGSGTEAEKHGRGPPDLCRWVCLGEVM